MRCNQQRGAETAAELGMEYSANRRIQSTHWQAAHSIKDGPPPAGCTQSDKLNRSPPRSVHVSSAFWDTPASGGGLPSTEPAAPRNGDRRDLTSIRAMAQAVLRATQAQHEPFASRRRLTDAMENGYEYI